MDRTDELPIDLGRETAALRRIARGILFEPSLAEDAVQEAWLAALRSQGNAAPSGGWLNEAVRRVASGMRRNEARRVRREHAGARPEALPSAADAAGRVELLRELLDALEALEEPYRTAVQLRLVDDLPPRAIAERLGVPVETARTRVKRGIERLRARLDAKNAHRRGEFLALLAPLAEIGHVGWTVGGLGGAKTLGSVLVGTKTKLVVVAAVVVATCVLWTRPWEPSTSPEATLEHDVAPAAASMEAVDAERAAESNPSALASQVEIETEAPDRSTAVEHTWRVRGRALHGRTEPMSNATIHIEIVSGYDGPGERIFDAPVLSGSDGVFVVELAPPSTAVRVVLHPKTPGFIGFRREQLVLRGAPAPQDLVVVLYPLDVGVSGVVLDMSGAPIASATVDARGGDTTTDHEGKFELRTSTLLEHEYVTAWAEGYAECKAVAHVAGGARVEGLELRLERSVLLHGQVLDDRGRPVEGATVDGPSFVGRRAKTDSTGRFVLDGLREHEEWLAIWIDAPGFVRLRRDFQDRKVPAEEVRFVLERGLELQGRVVDEAGTPLPGALVFLGDSANSSDAAPTIAGEEGRFVIRRVPRNEKHCGASLQGYAPVLRDLDLPGHGEFRAEVVLVLGPGLTARGAVVDDRGAPIPEASVYVCVTNDYLDISAGKSAADGTFTLAGIPEREHTHLECDAKGFVRTSVPLDPSSFHRIVMPRSAGLSGRVLDAATNAPIQRFRVRFVTPMLKEGEQQVSGYGAEWSDPGVDVSHADGRWSTGDEDLELDAVTALEISAVGYGPTIVPRAVATFDHEGGPIVVALSKGARVTGRVLDVERGTPIANAVVWRATPRDPLGPWEEYTKRSAANVRTDEQGAFAFENLPLEPMSLYVETAGFAPATDGPFDVGPNTRPRTVELRRGAKLLGRLLDSKNAPVANALVQVNRRVVPPGHDRDWELTTDETGRFELHDLVPGEYAASLMLRWERGATFDLSRSIVIEEPRDYSLELRPGGTGRVVGSIHSAREERASFSVSATRVGAASGESTRRAAIVAKGRFELDGLEAGEWKLIVMELGASGTARNGAADVVVDDDAETRVEVTVSRP
ncbi:MAG: sigma-70 family RNA polymerase sigma factor [Planctomycetes bacterium]|nr:sigma-70 family RNA polymerase sigma factor [Planctomycetota bacterium]